MLTATQALIARLRSGNIKQVTGVLGYPDGGRCCLGVTCDIGIEYGVIPPASVITDALSDPFVDPLVYGGRTKDLPEAVQTFFGFSTRVGNYTDSDGVDQNLARDNDKRGLTFAQIADIIESRPDGLFVKDVAENLLPVESSL